MSSLYSKFILHDEFIPVFVRISLFWALAVNMCISDGVSSFLD